MAYATQLTISTGNRVSLNYQSQEVSVTLTYQLEREDGDVQAVVRERAAELAQAHQAAWQTLRDAKVATAAQEQVAEQPAADTIESAVAVATPGSEPTAITNETLDLTVPLIAPGQVTALRLLLDQAQWSAQGRQDYLRDRCACESIEDLTAAQAAQWLLDLQRAARITNQEQRSASLNGVRKTP